MVHVITEEDFKPVLERLDRLEAENSFLRRLLMDLQWLNVQQVAKALNCSDKTVYRLIKEKRIEHRYENSRALCSLQGIRDYLATKKINPEVVDQRIIHAVHTYRTK